MLLTAVMVTSIFSVSLTARSGALRNDRRIKCQQASKQLAAQLRSFTKPTSYTGSDPAGPGSGLNGWSWDGVTGANGSAIDDNHGTNTWALSDTGGGVHRLSNYLPAELIASPYNGYIEYTVSRPGGAGTDTSPTVTITCSWDEP